jgi:hypothetical protein
LLCRTEGEGCLVARHGVACELIDDYAGSHRERSDLA